MAIGTGAPTPGEAANEMTAATTDLSRRAAALEKEVERFITQVRAA